MRKQAYKTRNRTVRSLLCFLLAVLLLLLGCIRLDRALRPNLCAVCAAETKRFVTAVLAESVASVLEQQPISYQDLSSLQYDSNGRVTAAEVRAETVNQLQSDLFQTVQTELAACQGEELHASLGTATGIWIFSGRGPYVKVRLMPIGNAEVKLISTLTSAGVNQTCHTIRIQVTAQVQAAIPFAQTTAEAVYEYLLAETVIVGDVPDAYVEFGGTPEETGDSVSSKNP